MKEIRTARGPLSGPWSQIEQNADLAVVAGVVLIIVMMVLPLPSFLLDILLAVNISLSLLVLLLTMNIVQPLQFSIFPSLLLVTTLFRLALNVSSTRLILLDGYAGQIITAFGNFVIGGNYVVGFVVFLILVVIQFVVITRGAERVAEVAARFTLDAMPGKQMSIDADLNAGLIDDAGARRRRQEIEREADFYGAMDGASKFVKGDAIASIIIALINILGGFVIGIGQKGMAFDEALMRYTLLTVGDGLVTQIPALLVSSATGIIVTRSASEESMGADLGKQLFSQPKVLGVAAGILFLFGVMPGLPDIPFMTLALGSGGLAFALSRQKRAREVAQVAVDRKKELEESKKPEMVAQLLAVDALELEIGYSLIPLVDAEKGGDLLDRITLIRRQLALELGFIVPPIRIRDNMQLPAGAYAIKVRGIEVGRGELVVNHFLAMEAGPVAQPVAGIKTTEPAFGLPALWIPSERREAAELAGYTVVDPPSVLATHLTEVVRRHASELLGRQEVKKLLDALKEEQPAAVEEVVPDALSLGEVQKVLQNLLREGVSVRDLATILAALADTARASKDPELLAQAAREALGRQISRLYSQESGFLPVITLDPRLEEELVRSLQKTDRGSVAAIDPARAQAILERVAQAAEQAAARGQQAVVLCAPSLRAAVRRLLQRQLPRLGVVAYTEVAEDAEVQAVGMVSLEDAG